MRNTLTCVLLALVCGLLHGAWIFGMQESSAMELLVNYSFGYFEIMPTALISLTISFFPLMMFQIVEGTEIFRHFCVAGVYIFSRCAHRRTWFLREAAKVYATALLFAIVWLGSGSLLAYFGGHLVVETVFWIAYPYQALVLSLWLFWTTMVINLLAVWLGSYRSTGAVIAFQILCAGLLALWQDEGALSLMPDGENLALHAGLLKCNPVAHLFLAWHSAAAPELNQFLNMYQIQFGFYESIVYMGILTFVVVITGCVLIGRVDFIVENKDY